MKFSRQINKNIPVINSYRAVGIIMVMIAHFTCNIVGFFSSPILPYLHETGYMAVIVFFTISGFVIPWWLFNSKYKINDYLRFVARRMIRIEPPFIVALSLAILYTYVRTLSPYYNGLETFPTIKQILLHLGYLIPFYEDQKWIRPAYWTLAIECQWYLVMGLLYPLFFHKKKVIRYCLYLLILVPCYFVNKYLLQYFPVLLMGTLLCAYVTETIEKEEYIIITTIYFLYMLFILGPIVAIPCLFIIPMLLYFANYNNSKLNFIGNMSYSIYLMHSLTGTALLNYLSHMIVNPFYKILAVAGGLVFTIITSYIFYKLIEKPSHKISLKIALNEYERTSKIKK